jgi:hypothetical protein
LSLRKAKIITLAMFADDARTRRPRIRRAAVTAVKSAGESRDLSPAPLRRSTQ